MKKSGTSGKKSQKHQQKYPKEELVETKSDCIFYDWGKTAPREYGAFCTYGRRGKSLTGQCMKCKVYKKERRKISDRRKTK